MHNKYKFNFCAGPAVLYPEVSQQLSEMIINYKDTGLSLLSISHRDSLFIEIYNHIIYKFRQLLTISDDYEILLMHGGATAQFSAVAINLFHTGKAIYIDSGYWSQRAMAEGQQFIDISMIKPGDSIKNNRFDYLHYTENETIDGYQFSEIPQTDKPLVCDMSSSFLSKSVDVNRYGIIYAGAQKNIGLPGLGVVIIKKSLLESAPVLNVPLVLNYRIQAQSKSLHNTPNVIAWAALDLTLDRLIKSGGLQKIERINEMKASRLYQAIDDSSLYENSIDQANRSKVNVVFRLNDMSLETQFFDFMKKAGIYGIEGHRSIGGARVSLYNAVSLAAVDYFIEKLQEFEHANYHHN
ncbi:MAG: 3-phosphoserine/phosphohydroxythreonine transaminase [Francisellaceae bacterium]